MQAYTNSGVIGNPSRETAEKGMQTLLAPQPMNLLLVDLTAA
jgi:hypothetical protein